MKGTVVRAIWQVMAEKQYSGSWPKRPKLTWTPKMRIKLLDPSLASSLPLRRTSEVARSDNASCLMPYASCLHGSRQPGYLGMSLELGECSQKLRECGNT